MALHHELPIPSATQPAPAEADSRTPDQKPTLLSSLTHAQSMLGAED